jgi:hypothetical protein
LYSTHPPCGRTEIGGNLRARFRAEGVDLCHRRAHGLRPDRVGDPNRRPSLAAQAELTAAKVVKQLGAGFELDKQARVLRHGQRKLHSPPD